MKKIIIHGPRKVAIEDVPVPKPGKNQILVKAELSGISAGTEMMLYRGTFPNFKLKKWAQWADYPVHPGYEFTGRVVEIGPLEEEDVSASGTASITQAADVLQTTVNDFKIGDRIICLGEHGEYALVPAAFAAVIPENVSPEHATLAVLATTAMHGVRTVKVEYGDTVVIIGCGILGYLTIQHIKNSGARKVIVSDVDDSRLQTAKEAGADYCFNPKKVDIVKAIKDVNDGLLADIAIEASGFKGTEQQAMDVVRNRGRVLFMGWHTTNLDITFGDFTFKELTFIASQAIGPAAGLPYSYVRWCSDQNLKWSVELISKGKIKSGFTPLKVPYTHVEEAYKMIDRHDPAAGMQIILDWS
jgi:L-iditol 2-dehydrogenase